MTNLPIRLVGEGGDQVAAQFEQAARGGTEAFDRMKRSAGEANTRLTELRGGFSGLSGGKVSSAAVQIGDFAVQVGNGARVSTALSQQLPQLLGGFGPLGAVIGAVAAVALPLGAAFLGAADEAEGLADRQDALADALNGVDASTQLASAGTAELVARYGEATQAVRDLIAAKAVMAQDQAAAAADELLGGQLRAFVQDARDASETAFGISAGVYAIVQQLQVAVPEAEQLAAAMRAAADAEGMREQADALERVRALIDAQRDAYGRLPGPLAAIYASIVDTEDMLRQGVAATDRLDAALGTASGTMSGLSAEATRAADEIARAAGNAMALKSQAQFERSEAALRLKYKGDPIGEAGALAGMRFDRLVGDISGIDPILRQQLQLDREEIVRARQDAARDMKALQEWNAAQREAAASDRKRGGASGGGAKSELVRQLERERETRDRVIDGLRFEREMIGQSELAQRISNETRAAGVDLTSDYGQQIAALVTEIDGLTAAQEQTAAVNGFLSESFGSLFKGAITGANSLKESVSQLALRLGDMALTRGFESLFSGFSLGGGGFGSFVSSLFGIGARAGGGPVLAGVPYLVGERGPELVVPRSSGSVVSNRQLSDALSGGGRQAPSGISVTVNGARGNSEIEAMVASGVLQALRAYDASLPERIGQIGMDPRYRG